MNLYLMLVMQPLAAISIRLTFSMVSYIRSQVVHNRGHGFSKRLNPAGVYYLKSPGSEGIPAPYPLVPSGSPSWPSSGEGRQAGAVRPLHCMRLTQVPNWISGLTSIQLEQRIYTLETKVNTVELLKSKCYLTKHKQQFIRTSAPAAVLTTPTHRLQLHADRHHTTS